MIDCTLNNIFIRRIIKPVKDDIFYLVLSIGKEPSSDMTKKSGIYGHITKKGGSVNENYLKDRVREILQRVRFLSSTKLTQV